MERESSLRIQLCCMSNECKYKPYGSRERSVRSACTGGRWPVVRWPSSLLACGGAGGGGGAWCACRGRSPSTGAARAPPSPRTHTSRTRPTPMREYSPLTTHHGDGWDPHRRIGFPSVEPTRTSVLSNTPFESRIQMQQY